jgi:adenylate cyclase
MVDCVEKTGGVVDKFIGDAVMAHWGTAYSAGSPEKDAYNCVKAALMMRSSLMEMNTGRRVDDPGNPPIYIGCGINSGIVTAGQIGSEARMEYTAIGDPVNLASRTEALNKPLGTDILITEDTWNLIGDLLITEEMPPVQVKGKEKPIRMFAVVNCRASEGETQEDPVTLAQVRKMLDIDAVDVSKVNINKEEKKYKIGK